jgi:hypothetical protein
MKRVNLIRSLALLVLVLGFHSQLAAQDFRASITGTVTDDTGAVLPGVTITVTNTSTNVPSVTTTNDRGLYQVRYLISGPYTVKAELQGFQTVVRPDIELRVGDAPTVDIVMTIGTVSEALTVTASTPYLDTTSTTTGQVIDREMIKELPLADGTAYMLTRMTAGVTDVSDLHFARPMDNANLGYFITNGVKGGNDFTIDGAPNAVSYQDLGNGARIGFSPPSDSIAEFRINTNDFDAQQGHTAGANVNLALRSGGNAFHGAASYFNRSSGRSENSIYSERAGNDVLDRTYDRYTAMFSGPIFRDKTFFMVSYENLLDETIEPTTYTVPTEKMRSGDFSELLPLGIIIYDPLTGNTNRTPFPGNIIPPERLNQIALALMNYYPLPNQAGLSNLSNNYYSNQNRSYDYEAALMRLDHNFSQDHKLAFTGYWNERTEDRYNWAGEQNGFEVTRGFDMRSNLGFTATYTGLFSPTFIGDIRASWSEFGEAREPAQSFDPASLGWSADVVELFRGYQYLPRFDIAGGGVTVATLGSQRSDYSAGRDNPFYNTSAAATATWALANHTLRAGYDLRIQEWKRKNDEYLGGRYNFTGEYTRRNRSASTSAWQPLAQFLLGIPTSGGNSMISNNTTGDFSQTWHSLFAQDTWNVTPNLTVNFGVRAEYDMGLRESGQRNINGFDLTAVSPLDEAASAAYAANPIPEIPVEEFQVLGGMVYSGNPIYEELLSVLPRASASYQIGANTLLRGGIGLFSYPYIFDGINQAGYSQATQLISTTDSGATFIADLYDPFPNGLEDPPGSSQGLATWAGRDLVADANTAKIINYDREVPQYTRWQLGVQQHLGAGWMAELNYVGSRGSNLAVRRDLNGLPAEYVSFDRSRDADQAAYLTTNVPNPYKGLLPGTTINGSTVQRRQLLVPYSQFLRVAVEQYNGSDEYNAGQLVISKRFTKGLAVIGTYTYSKLTEKVAYLNSFDTELQEVTSPNDRPNRASLAVTYPLPFGHGRKWGSDWSSVADAFLGGWTISASYQYQQGFPLTQLSSGQGIGWPHVYFDPNCDWDDLRVGDVGSTNSQGQVIGLDVPAWNTSCFYFHDAPVQTNGVDDPVKQRNDTRIAMDYVNARYFPLILDNMRMPDLQLIDIGLSKNFKLSSTVVLQIRADWINAIDYTAYWDPDLNPRSATFGTFRSQRNNPRDIQIGGRLTF